MHLFLERVGSEEIACVNARHLYADLGVKQQFVTWIRTKLLRGRFREGVHYVAVKENNPSARGPARLNYFIAPEAAKWICTTSYKSTARRIAQEIDSAPVKKEDLSLKALIKLDVERRPPDYAAPVAYMRASRLREVLGTSSQHFSVWIARQVGALSLKEGVDYEVRSVQGDVGRPRREYFLTIEATKKVCAHCGTRRARRAKDAIETEALCAISRDYEISGIDLRGDDE